VEATDDREREKGALVGEKEAFVFTSAAQGGIIHVFRSNAHAQSMQ